MKTISFLDAIHGTIEFDLSIPEEALAFQLINTPEFQRLRRIRQQGFSSLTYAGAESSRYVHSIGVFDVARRYLNALSTKHAQLIARHRLPILLAALLHDIGHGPFSHSSEPAFDFCHELWTMKVLTSDTQISHILRSYDEKLPDTIVSILAHDYGENAWASEIVSGQMDCDRADYLLRDSHMTGATYGCFQLERVISSLDIVHFDGSYRLAIGTKSLNSVEDYLFARYSMYLQVYHHKTTLSADAIFMSAMSRARDLYTHGSLGFIDPHFAKWLDLYQAELDMQSFLSVDDSVVLYHLHRWASDSDDILSDLSRRLLARRLFRAIRLDALSADDITALQSDIPPNMQPYYCLIKECKEFPYNDKKKPILIRESDGSVHELSCVSRIAQALLNKDQDLDLTWLFIPKD